jgi:predicted flap endonuclease-1-like 5' DNA nuclease
MLNVSSSHSDPYETSRSMQNQSHSQKQKKPSASSEPDESNEAAKPQAASQLRMFPVVASGESQSDASVDTASRPRKSDTLTGIVCSHRTSSSTSPRR